MNTESTYRPGVTAADLDTRSCLLRGLADSEPTPGFSYCINAGLCQAFVHVSLVRLELGPELLFNGDLCPVNQIEDDSVPAPRLIDSTTN